jgi:hypothetical protein
MTDAASNAGTRGQADQHLIFGLTTEQYRVALACLMFVSSFFVIIEPAPSEFLFALLFVACVSGGITLDRLLVPLIALLMLYNLGGLISLQQRLHEPGKSQLFVIISAYMAISGIFFAGFVAQNTRSRLEAINTAWIIGATIAGLLGVIGFMNLGGFGEKLTLFGRATSTFKDPNVFSTYLIYPTVVASQRLLLGSSKHPILLTFALLVMLAGQFLALSRGGWAFYILSTLIALLLTFVFSSSTRLRSRITLLSFMGGVTVVVMIALLLTIEPVRRIFEIRFSLQQSYDLGETGRFGNQLNSIPLLLQRPLGFGPLEFSWYFGEAPHNTFLNAFSAYGWLGGISYFALIGVTLWVMFRALFRGSPYRDLVIPVFAVLLCLILQGVQIDTEHWRHFYWLLGFIWGLFIAAERLRANSSGVSQS